MRWQDVLGAAARQLEQAKVDSPRLVAEVLLAHALGVQRVQLLAGLAEALREPERAGLFQALVERCAAGEPLAYVVGQQAFYDLDFECDPRALIPRPETELLVEALLEARFSTPAIRLADVGTGTGCVGVTLAVHLPDALVYAIDASPGALELARRNARRHNVAERVIFLHGDVLAALPVPVHAMAANLPYVSTAEWEALPDAIRLHEPRAALDGGADGLDLVRRLLAEAPGRLLPGGRLALEIGAQQGPAAAHLAQRAFPSARVTLKQDYAGLDRLVVIET